MTAPQLEKRLSRLEAEIAGLKQKLSQPARAQTAWWEQIIGRFANNPAYDEAMQLGRKYRESLVWPKRARRGGKNGRP